MYSFGLDPKEIAMKNAVENITENEISMAPKSPTQPEILFFSSYPPRECGIATYTHDLVKALGKKFGQAINLSVCALETGKTDYMYPKEVTHQLDITKAESYKSLINSINHNELLHSVIIQHEFGLFYVENKNWLLDFLFCLNKPIVVVFHTVLPHPELERKAEVKNIASACESVIVMTQNAAKILENDYEIEAKKIHVIAHGTHLVTHANKASLKEKYGLQNKKVLSTFGLLSSGKSIETTLDSLPAIVQKHPDVLFLIIGKTHPSVVKAEGEKYREALVAKVKTKKLEKHVQFINKYVSLPQLLEYLQLTDIYLFTSKDPYQAVSGTFSYAMSCACPIISTRIPHALEMLGENSGLIVDFQHSKQLAQSTIRLLEDDQLRANISLNALQKSIATAWENSALAHAQLFENMGGKSIPLVYQLPPLNLAHFRRMTTSFGIIQFAKINEPDLESGYTLDDNVRALLAICMHFEQTGEKEDLQYIQIFLHFISYCMRPNGYLLNYVNANKEFTAQNETTNLADANGRAIWALGYLVTLQGKVPSELTIQAEEIINAVLPRIEMMFSTRAMAFAIKGLGYCYQKNMSQVHYSSIKILSNRLLSMYNHESEKNWEWYECYLTYGNSVLPEAMLHAWKVTGEPLYKDIAKTSFDFLLKNTFKEEGIKVISNKSWMKKGQLSHHFGEQPIDVAYTILALANFYEVFQQQEYLQKMKLAFDWFLGKNHLRQVIYNPATGGCFDGLEETQINLNQGAESTICYLLARMTMEKYKALIA